MKCDLLLVQRLLVAQVLVYAAFHANKLLMGTHLSQDTLHHSPNHHISQRKYTTVTLPCHLFRPPR